MQQYLPNHPILAELVVEVRPRIAALEAFYAAQVALVGQGGEALALARTRTLRGEVLFDDFRGVAERMLVDTEVFVANAQERTERRLPQARGLPRRARGTRAPDRRRARPSSSRAASAPPTRASARARARVDRLRAVQFELTGLTGGRRGPESSSRVRRSSSSVQWERPWCRSTRRAAIAVLAAPR